jgi:hypothetical protein
VVPAPLLNGGTTEARVYDMADVVRHVIYHRSNPRLSSYMASEDVASIISMEDGKVVFVTQACRVCIVFEDTKLNGVL